MWQARARLGIWHDLISQRKRMPAIALREINPRQRDALALQREWLPPHSLVCRLIALLIQGGPPAYSVQLPLQKPQTHPIWLDIRHHICPAPIQPPQVGRDAVFGAQGRVLV